MLAAAAIEPDCMAEVDEQRADEASLLLLLLLLLIVNNFSGPFVGAAKSDVDTTN